MNFFEVKIGRTSRRGSFESFNSFVAKTEMDYSQLYSELKDRYKGFEVSIKTVEIIEEFKKAVSVNVEVKPTPTKTIRQLVLKQKYHELPLEIRDLRSDFISKKELMEKAESNLKSSLVSYFKEKHKGLYFDIRDIKSTFSNYGEIEYTLILNGELQEILENEKQEN
jgi:hypothetical protein